MTSDAHRESSPGPAAVAQQAEQEEVETAFGLTGLTSAEAARRLRDGRGNLAAWKPSRSYWQILRDNAVTPVNLVLSVICVVLLRLGLYGDAFMTGGLVVGNVFVAVFQEARAKRQLDRLALLTRPQSRVIRDGAEIEIAPEQVVEGDLLVLRPGDQVVVDGPAVLSQALGMDESLLTGEADTVQKKPGDSVVSGSFCVAGTGVYEAAKVGGATVASEITAQARENKAPRTPLQKEVDLIVAVMSLVVIFLGATLAHAWSPDVPVSEAVRAAAVIVALVPQGLVTMVTVSYAMAAVRMAGSGVLVQHMNALESLSHVDVLCIDKTGTITTNRLKLESVAPLEMEIGELRTLLGDFAASSGYANRTLEGIKEALPGSRRQIRDEVPFESRRRWSGIVFDGSGARRLVLGAPEVLLPRIHDADSIERQVAESAQTGLRVLLFASADGLHFTRTGEGDPQLPDELRALGLVVLRDETRSDAAPAVTELAATGIDLKIISGDNPETVAAVARQAGIQLAGEPVAGPELEQISDEELGTAACASGIFGRISPAMKARLVEVLQKTGRYVAMVGDGVNDVPAMKTAQVAVSVRSGSAITRSIADLVLLRDEFSRLPTAFREGQRVLNGMDGIFRVFLTRTLSLTLVLLAVSLLGDPFPVSPRHTALISTLTVGVPSLGLAAWAQPGRTPRKIGRSSAPFVVPAGLSIAAAMLGVYEYFWHTTGDLEQSRTALTVTAVLCGLLIVLFLQPPARVFASGTTQSPDWRPAAMTGTLLLGLVLTLASSQLRDLYELELPDAEGFLLIVAVVAAWAIALGSFWQLRPPSQAESLEFDTSAQARPSG